MNRSHCALFAMGLMLCPQINASADDLAYNLEFTGEPDPDNPALLAITDTGMGSGNMLASGVGVEILNDDQDTISINNADSVVYPLKAGRNTLSFYIRYKSTRPTVTSGNATAVMYFDMQYE